MSKPYFQSVHLRRFLSFGPDSEPITMQGLNVLIGPNGSGKSNLIEAFELLRATPGDLAGFVRQGGGASEFMWKGAGSPAESAHVAVVIDRVAAYQLQHRLELSEAMQRLEIIDEAIEETQPRQQDDADVQFYYRFGRGQPVFNPQNALQGLVNVGRLNIDSYQSVLSQRREPNIYPELTGVAQTYARIATFREWSFGRQVALRQPQPADLPTDLLLPDLRNLGLVLNDIEHSDRWNDLNAHIGRFLPRFRRLSTRIQAGHVQIYLHEDGLRTPTPATRLSDGTIRFIALLAILVRPETASLICIEEPELGLHPDAVGLLSSLLVEASKVTQLVVTTHSDALVSALSETPESVLVAEHLDDGTHLRRLEAEKLRFWLETYRLGEIWRMGELGGNP